jgi:cysteine desulfurase/selenocysteine lyase
MLDVKGIRSDFPILSKGVIYFDNAASSLTPEQVVLKEMEFYREYRANVERGVHRFSQEASEEYEGAHEIVADFIGSPSADCVAMLRNTTEGLNLVANSLNFEEGGKIVTTMIEHHSNFITWLRVAKRSGCTVEVVRPDREGLFDVADFEAVIDDSTRLVAVTRVSNVLGCKVPVEEIVSLAHDHGAMVVEDGAQGVPHMPTDVMGSGVDFMAFSGHKMLGPTGVGGLYICEEELYSTEPLSIGGGTISDVSLDGYELAVAPLRFEAGTPAIAQVIGLGEACRYLDRVGMEEVETRDEKLSGRIAEGLREIDGVEVYGPIEPRDRVGIVSFNVGELNSHDVALSLDAEHGIAVRSGHHCALPLMKDLLGLPEGTARASTYLYNTLDEVELFLGAIEDIAG